MKKEQSSFKRKEEKFVIIDSTFDEIREELEKHIPVHNYEKDCLITSIKTTYMDSENFDIFKEYLEGRKYRYKIRFRQYGYDNKFSDELWAELKVKHKKISYKRRFLLPEKLYQPFINQEDIFSELRKVNKGLPGFAKLYKLMTELIKINNFIPVLLTSYDRIAFQKKSKRIRITIDKNIHHKALHNSLKQCKLRILVFESKILGRRPKWYKKLEDRLSLLPQKRFSKFATGINSTYYPARGTYNFYTNFAEIKKKQAMVMKSLELINSTLKLETAESEESAFGMKVKSKTN